MPIFLFLIVLGVLLVCVVAMAVGVIMGRNPIKHCGSVVDANGNTVSCSVCGNMTCSKRKKEAQVPEEAAAE